MLSFSGLSKPNCRANTGHGLLTLLYPTAAPLQYSYDLEACNLFGKHAKCRVHAAV